MRILVCGSRNWTDPEPIRRELEPLRQLGWNELNAKATADWEAAGRPCGCGRKHDSLVVLCSHGPAIATPWFEDGSRAITIVHGDARGADKMAGAIAGEKGFQVVPVPAQWEKYGKKAGVLRNEQMLREYGPIDLVIAFHEDLPRSKGTKDMIARAVRDGIKVIIVSKPRVKGGYGATLSRTLAR